MKKPKEQVMSICICICNLLLSLSGPLLWGLFHVNVELICRRAHQECLSMDHVMLGEFEFDLVKARLIDLLSEF